MRAVFFTFFLALCTTVYGYAQNDSVAAIPSRLFSRINRKIAALNHSIDRETQRSVQRFMQQETALRRQYMLLDSNAAKSLFLSDPQQKYPALLSQVRSDSGHSSRLNGGYLPYADSLHGVLAFMGQQKAFMGGVPATGSLPNVQATASLQQLQVLQAKLNADEQLREYIVARKDQIKQYLSVQTYVPRQIQAIYNQYNVGLYYYSAQLQQYRDMLNDRGKLVAAALQVLDRLPAFGSFMKRNSFLSAIPGVPDDYDMAASVAGMQTRGMVNEMLQKQVNGSGPNAASALSQCLQTAQGKLDQLKSKLSSLGGGSQDADLPPGFNPNQQKTKTFLQRLEYGMNIQTQQSNQYFPVTNDIALTLGYKLNDKSTVGIGVSYKVGWGQGIEHIRISSQGIGLRSSLDIRIKGNWYASGGLEYNYQQPFASPAVLPYLKSWQQSGLIGISRTVPVHMRFFRQMKIQALWDFLSYQQVPQAQPIKIRVGYNF